MSLYTSAIWKMSQKHSKNASAFSPRLAAASRLSSKNLTMSFSPLLPYSTLSLEGRIQLKMT